MVTPPNPPEPDPAATQAIVLPAVLLSRYLFFLTRRPISASNSHYLQRRVRGLRSLGSRFADLDDPAAVRIERLLRTLNPGNAREVAERIQLTLAPFTRTELPASYVTSDGPVPDAFWDGAHRVLVVLAPAIGIGDEIITFPLPSWLKATGRAAEVTVMTAYDGLWDRVAAVDRIVVYDTHAEIVDAISGDGDLERFDVVMVVDFENPDLHEAVASHAGIDRYVEVSLGAQVASAIDTSEKILHRVSRPRHHIGGFYHGFDAMAEALALAPDGTIRFDDVVKHAERDGDGELRVYVSPFSSKYDPSARYWSGLLTRVGRRRGKRPVRVVLDPGPNLSTRRFATEVTRAVATTLPGGVTCEVAAGDSAHGLSLAGELAELDRSDAVICADSFAAHASAVLGCTTLVVASPGLERWRVPAPSSFYLDAVTPIETTADAIDEVLAIRAGPARNPTPDWAAAVDAAAADLEAVLDSGSGVDLAEMFDRFAAARSAAVAAASAEGLRAVLGDFPYEMPLRPVDLDLEDPVVREASLLYARTRLTEWRGTNLAKLIAVTGGEAP